MISHTPGPWRANYRNSPSGEWFDGVVGPDGERIRVDGLTLTSGPVARANSVLIAAAPDLLEALQEVMEAHAVPSSICAERPAYDKARAAIAKALGETK